MKWYSFFLQWNECRNSYCVIARATFDTQIMYVALSCHISNGNQKNRLRAQILYYFYCKATQKQSQKIMQNKIPLHSTSCPSWDDTHTTQKMNKFMKTRKIREVEEHERASEREFVKNEVTGQTFCGTRIHLKMTKRRRNSPHCDTIDMNLFE